MAKKPDPAATYANQALAPVLAEIQRQKAEEARRARNAQATAGASAQGLAAVLGEIPGRTQDTYKQAGDSAFEYGRRLGQSFASGSKDAAAELQAVLDKNGSPQQIQAAGDRGGAVVGGLGLYDANALAREGAGFTAAAHGLGAAALGRGQEEQNQIGRESRDKLSQLDALLRGEKAKIPGLAQEFTRNERAYQLDLKQDARSERELRLRERESNRPNPQIFGSGETGYMTFDPKTGKVTRLTSAAPAGANAPELIGSSDSGYYAWDAQTGELTPVLQPTAKPKFTPKETRAFKQDAYAMAYDAFWGIKDKDGKVTSQPMHYQEALAWMMKSQQIPLVIAQNALNGFWKKPGFWSDVQSRVDGTPQWIDFRKKSEKGVTGRPLKPIQERKPQGESVPVDPAAEAEANTVGGTTVLNSKSIPGWNDKTISAPVRNALAIAHAQIGKPYVWGGESPSEGGFDCSGLIEYAFEQAGIKTPGRLTTWSAMNLGKPVKGALKPGDWVIVNGGKHIVLYAGKGQVIAAPHRGAVVQYQSLDRFKGSIVAVRRFA